MSAATHVTDLLAAYALDCLDEAESGVVSEHLAECADCRAALRSYQTVTDQLALAVPDAAPPSDLKARLMNRIQPARPTEPAQPRTSWWERLNALMRRSTPVWGLVGLVLIAALVVSNLWLWGRVSRPPTITEPEVFQTIRLTGTEAAPAATGLLVVSPDGEHGTLVVDSLSPLGSEQQYQLWLISEDGQRTDGGVFSVSDEGYGSLWIESPQPLSSYPAFGITIEPAGGSPGPTGDKVLGSTL